MFTVNRVLLIFAYALQVFFAMQTISNKFITLFEVRTVVFNCML